MSRYGITTQDTLVLKFLQAYIATYKTAPTYRAIVKGCQLSSISAVKRHLERLEEAGYLTHEPRKLRSIRLVEREAVAE
jgi:repressor LexA